MLIKLQCQKEINNKKLQNIFFKKGIISMFFVAERFQVKLPNNYSRVRAALNMKHSIYYYYSLSLILLHFYFVYLFSTKFFKITP